MNRELKIILAKYFTIVALTIAYIVIMIQVVGPLINQAAFGQTAPPPVSPTPVPTPTPTSPNPNLQYLPQKAYVQAYAPENGIPATSGQLQVVPQVVPAPQQSSGIGIPTDIMGILAMVGAAGAYLKGHLANNKADKAQDIGKENAAMNVKQGIIQEESLKLQYENMPDKGVNITDKPEIRLTEVAKMKDKAVDTATKS